MGEGCGGECGRIVEEDGCGRASLDSYRERLYI
jgi:hypothetical protein